MHSGLTTPGSREISVASRSSSRSDAHRPGHGVARSTVTASKETGPRKTKRPVRAPAANDAMRVAMLAPISWRVPPRHYGPWERVVSLLTEGLVERGVDVTLFATADSVTQARLDAIRPRPLGAAPGARPRRPLLGAGLPRHRPRGVHAARAPWPRARLFRTHPSRQRRGRGDRGREGRGPSTRDRGHRSRPDVFRAGDRASCRRGPRALRGLPWTSRAR